jgi:hypothetical protein
MPAPVVRANDYCQNFVDTGERPQNFIRNVELENRFEEFPAKRELMERKARHEERMQRSNAPLLTCVTAGGYHPRARDGACVLAVRPAHVSAQRGEPGQQVRRHLD